MQISTRWNTAFLRMGCGTLDRFLVREETVSKGDSEVPPGKDGDEDRPTKSRPYNSICGPITFLYALNGQLSREVRAHRSPPTSLKFSCLFLSTGPALRNKSAGGVPELSDNRLCMTVVNDSACQHIFNEA